MFSTTFSLDMYPITFHALWGPWDELEARKITARWDGCKQDAIEHLMDHAPGDHSLGKCWDYGAHQVLWVLEPPHAGGGASLVHELVHAVANAGDYVGHTEAGSEFHAYLSDYAYSIIMDCSEDSAVKVAKRTVKKKVAKKRVRK